MCDARKDWKGRANEMRSSQERYMSSSCVALTRTAADLIVILSKGKGLFWRNCLFCFVAMMPWLQRILNSAKSTKTFTESDKGSCTAIPGDMSIFGEAQPNLQTAKLDLDLFGSEPAWDQLAGRCCVGGD